MISIFLPPVTVQTYNVGLPIEVYQYRPANYDRKKLIVVFHGTNRNADEYCLHAKGLADKYGALVIAPKFDEKRFPSWRYHRGGVFDSKGIPQPEINWTYTMVKKIIKQVQIEEGAPLKYWLIGHSAGGQFLNRMCAFSQEGAERVIVANPGSLIFPRTDWDFAYGFGRVPLGESRLQAYLAQPMALLLGDKDNKPDEYFDASKPAMLQGGGRFQRGTNCFELGKRIAQERGWKFNWKRIVVKGSDHDHEKMFGAPNIDEAFGISK